MKSMIEEVAELLNLGYSAHEITRIFHIPVSVAEDIIQQALISWAKQDHVVWNARPSALDAQMQHKQRWRPTFPAE